MADEKAKEAPTGINRLIAERRIEQALMTLGLTFAECSGLVEYDAQAETAFWRYNPETGVESIHIGPKVANLDQGSIEMVLRHEILHRSLYHGFGEKYVNRELCNLTLDVCINRLLFEAYPEKMRKCSEQMYPADSKLTPIALADCSADATRLPDELSTLWQSIWAKQADGSYPSVNPASLYFRLLRLSELPTWIVFTMGRPPYDGPGKPSSRAGRLVVAVADEIARRLPKGSDLGRVLSDYTVVPISIGNGRVEEFLKKLRVRKIADATAAKVLEPFQRQVVVQPFPAFPSRLGIVYRLCGVSELFFRYWNKEVANSGARMAIGVYMDVSGSMIDKFAVVSGFVNSLKEYPLKVRVFDTEVREVDVKALSEGRIKGGGGTDFDAPINSMLGDRDIEAAVLFTDGEARVTDGVGRMLRRSKKRLFVVYLIKAGQAKVQSPLDRYAKSAITVTLD
jgi:hypothetical protein